VVAYQPTLITSDFDQTRMAATRLNEARAARSDGAIILPTHLEGPFLSPRRAGTHPLALLRDPDLDLLERLLDLDNIGLMTIAPELPGALELIEHCRRRGATVSLGHSAASAEEAERGFEAGASTVTHLFNAMESLSSRAPGLAGAALTRAGVTVQLIADGLHVADEMMRLAFAVAPGRCIIVTDAIAAAASDKSVVQLGEVTVYVDSDVAQRDDGTLAGSIGKLRDNLVRLSALGIAPADALGAAISRPAALLGGQHLVTMTPGSASNLFVVDDDLAMTRRVTPHDIVDF
jgi:N-acetylglucosamine-6-phosphate deacetylase